MSFNEKLKKLEKFYLPKPEQEIMFYLVSEGGGKEPLPFQDTEDSRNLVIVAFSL